MFSQQCPACHSISKGDHCTEATCRRRFLFPPGSTPKFCPLHDPAEARREPSPGYRTWRFKKALRCPQCGHNLFGVKPEDAGG